MSGPKPDEDGQRFWERLCGGNYAVVPSHLLFDPSLTVNERALYAVLCAFAMDRDQCWPSSSLLCAILGWSDRTLRRTRQSLAEKNCLTLLPGINNTWRYELHRSGPNLPKSKDKLRRIKTVKDALGAPKPDAAPPRGNGLDPVDGRYIENQGKPPC